MTSAASPGIHQISNQFTDDYARLDPTLATLVGTTSHNDELPDYSPAGHQSRAELSTTALRAIEATKPVNSAETTAKAVFCERIGLELEIYDAGLRTAALNVVDSPIQQIRETFDLMPTDTAEDWAVIARRLALVPQALAGIRTTFSWSAQQGTVPALRQVNKVAKQCETWAGSTGDLSFFANLIASADSTNGVSAALRAELESGAAVATAAYAELGQFLRNELAPLAPAKDAVGKDTYQLWSRYFTGATVDLVETYRWGWDEFFRIESEMKQLANRIKPGAGLAETAAVLDADPRYRVQGKSNLQIWMQELSDNALASLSGKHFEIPDPIMNLECRIAPPGGGNGAYYTGPNEDFSRPGQMWWSIPVDQQNFPIWREISTVYHEGVPGHHLQVATAVYQTESLNRFQRLMVFCSGHSEGWALYAERLMHELGYLEDEGALMGMLDAHLFRAARVIIDIGMHLELEIPAGTGFHEGEHWTPELGLEFLLERTITNRAVIPDEIDRYLGWPGQAPSYKLGERLWLAARADVQQRQGSKFELKRFHQQALELGCLGLDTLREQLASL